MPTNSIAKQSGTTFPPMINAPNAAGIIADTVDGFVKYDDAGSVRTVVNVEETQTISGNKTFTGTVALTGAGQVQRALVTLTNAEFLALGATQKTLVAAPGVGFALQLLGATISIDYTAAYTESADNLSIRYTDGSGAKASADIETTGWVTLTADSMVAAIPLATGPQLMTTNAALVLDNDGDGEFGGGNAANVIHVDILYRVVAFP